MQLGFELMLMGMSTVFAFLILLIFCMTIMSKMVTLIEKKPIEIDPIEIDQNKIPDNTLIAVISAAIHQHLHKG